MQKWLGLILDSRSWDKDFHCLSCLYFPFHSYKLKEKVQESRAFFASPGPVNSKSVRCSLSNLINWEQQLLNC